jgi:hypothetical protein
VSGTRAFTAVMSAAVRYGGSGPSFGLWTGEPGVRARFDRMGRVRVQAAPTAAQQVARKSVAVAAAVVAGLAALAVAAGLGVGLMYLAATAMVGLR